MATPGEALRAWIEAREMDQADVCRLTGLDKGTVSAYVNDKRKRGQLATWRTLARAVDVTAEMLKTGVMPGEAHAALDSGTSTGRLPGQLTTAEGGVVRMLTLEEESLVIHFRMARQAHAEEAQAILNLVTDVALGRRSLLGKAPRHSGGKA